MSSIGTGDGDLAAFQLVKRYDLVFVVTRVIQLPVEGTVEISVDGDLVEEETDYTVDYSTGLVTFDSRPGRGRSHHRQFRVRRAGAVCR